MGKRSPGTTNSQIRAALRKLFLRSRERSVRLKLDGYTCQECGAKQIRAKGREVYVECHHLKNIDKNWDIMISCIREYLLVDVEDLKTLCKDCHKNAHKKL